MYLVGLKIPYNKVLKIFAEILTNNVYSVGDTGEEYTYNALMNAKQLNKMPQDYITGIFALTDQLLTTVNYCRLMK